MKLGELIYAINLLEKILSPETDLSPKTKNKRSNKSLHGYEELYGLYGICLWIKYCTDNLHEMGSEQAYALKPPEQVLEFLEISTMTQNPSPLYKWLYLIAENYYQIPRDMNKTFQSKANEENLKIEELFVRLAAINQCPFDSPLLLQLDHKVHLHNYLSNKAKTSKISFWPKGYIFPRDISEFKENNEDSEIEEYSWILKEAAGYGSHGNRLVTTKEAKKIRYFNSDADSEINSNKYENFESILCQKVVHPPLLLGKDGRKFSLRVYVVLLSSVNPMSNVPTSSSQKKQEQKLPWKVYLSSVGLVKLASAPYNVNIHVKNAETDESSTNDFDSSALDSMHMTNSGRETSMQQYDFHFLKQQFKHLDFDYDKFWSKIESIVCTTMTQNWNDTILSPEINGLNTNHFMTGQMYIPKILGFDFVVSENLQPWLLEVNRFPGLEPRDNCDYRVKYKVVTDSWTLAAKLVSSESHDGSQNSSLYSSLRRACGLDLFENAINDLSYNTEFALTRIL